MAERVLIHTVTHFFVGSVVGRLGDGGFRLSEFVEVGSVGSKYEDVFASWTPKAQDVGIAWAEAHEWHRGDEIEIRGGAIVKVSFLGQDGPSSAPDAPRLLIRTVTHYYDARVIQEGEWGYVVDHCVEVSSIGSTGAESHTWQFSSAYPPAMVHSIPYGAVVSVVHLAP